MIRSSTTTWALALILLGGVSTCPAEHMLDRAGRALSEGDTKQAVELYRHAVSEDPTSTGYNNLGVALERDGQFTEAAKAIRQAAQLMDDPSGLNTNLRRIRLRVFLQSGCSYAVWTSGVLLITWLLCRLIVKLTRCAAQRRLWQQFRGVVVTSLEHQVLCQDGQPQPDGRIYPDSKRIIIKAGIRLPQRDDIYPLRFELQLGRQDGSVVHTIPMEVKERVAERITLVFTLNKILALLRCPGIWKVSLVLENTRQRLASSTLLVVSRADLIADLVIKNAQLVAQHQDRQMATDVILPNVECVIPTAVLRSRFLHPSKFSQMNLRVDLVRRDHPEDSESCEFPLEIANGEMEFCSILRAIAGNAMAHKTGHWEFRFSVENRLLARLPFLIMPIEQALENLQIERFDVIGIPHHGEPFAVGKQVCARDLESLCPVIRVACRPPLPWGSFRLTVGIYLDGELIDGQEGTLVLDDHQVEVMPGQFVLPDLPEASDGKSLCFGLFVESKLLGTRSVTLRPPIPRFADAEGRLVKRLSGNQVDYEVEADRILCEALSAGKEG